MWCETKINGCDFVTLKLKLVAHTMLQENLCHLKLLYINMMRFCFSCRISLALALSVEMLVGKRQLTVRGNMVFENAFQMFLYSNDLFSEEVNSMWISKFYEDLV